MATAFTLDDHVEHICAQYDASKAFMSKRGYRITLVILNMSIKADRIFRDWMLQIGHKIFMHAALWKHYSEGDNLNLRCYFYPDTMTAKEAEEERDAYRHNL